VLAVASLVIGNVTAIAQTNLKRMLAYSTIAQMGFMLLAMLSGVVGGSTMTTANAWSAALFYVITYAHHHARHLRRHAAAGAQGFEARRSPT
jgi:NADH-quinone oxidoreductase subunit N